MLRHLNLPLSWYIKLSNSSFVQGVKAVGESFEMLRSEVVFEKGLVLNDLIEEIGICNSLVQHLNHVNKSVVGKVFLNVVFHLILLHSEVTEESVLSHRGLTHLIHLLANFGLNVLPHLCYFIFGFSAHLNPNLSNFAVICCKMLFGTLKLRIRLCYPLIAHVDLLNYVVLT